MLLLFVTVEWVYICVCELSYYSEKRKPGVENKRGQPTFFMKSCAKVERRNEGFSQCALARQPVF